MASGKSNYLSNALLNHTLGGNTGGQSYTAPATVYIALWTATLSASSTGSTAGEVSGSGYARVAVANTTAQWAATSTEQKTNVNSIAFPANSGANGAWGTITYMAICDAATNGNILYFGALTASKNPNASDVPTFTASSIVITEA